MPGWDYEKLCRDKPEVAEAMKVLGSASPTANASNKEVKGGYRDDEGGWCKAYYTSNDLVMLSNGLLEMAKWLDRRAMSDN